jgi:hypothetical protein
VIETMELYDGPELWRRAQLQQAIEAVTEAVPVVRRVVRGVGSVNDKQHTLLIMPWLRHRLEIVRDSEKAAPSGNEAA